MQLAFEIVLYVVFGGGAVMLGVSQTAPQISGKALAGWTLFILFGVPLCLLLLLVAFGINL